MYYVYILKLNDRTSYIGSTNNLKNRLKYHNSGKCKSTKDKKPLKLHWFCVFENKSKAIKFEQYLKSGSGTAFRHNRLE